MKMRDNRKNANKSVSKGFARDLNLSGILAIFISLGFLAGLAWAGDVWKSKPYTQWNEDEVRDILTRSPWVKTEAEPVEWRPEAYRPSLPQASSPGQTGTAGQTGTGQPGQMGNPAGAQQPGSPYGQASGFGAQTNFYIRWVSSHVMREAFLRAAVLRGKMEQAQAATELAKPIGDYEIAVTGPDMTPFVNATDDSLKASSSMELKQSKQKIAPTGVTIEKDVDGRVQGVLFSFPRKTADGRDLIGGEEKGVQFRCKVKGLDLRAGFDPRKMVGQNGPDL